MLSDIKFDDEKKLPRPGTAITGTEDSPHDQATADIALPASLCADVKAKPDPLTGKASERPCRRKAGKPVTQIIDRQPDYPGQVSQLATDNPEFKVLIVDDCRPTRFLVRSILNTCGLRDIEDVADGAEALEAIDTAVPDLVISDLLMIPLDGIELSRLIRKNPRSPNPNLPIVIMTSHTEMNWIVELRNAGLKEVVAKPLSPSVLCRNIIMALRSQDVGDNSLLPDHTD